MPVKHRKYTLAGLDSMSNKALWKETGEEPMLQRQERTWNWLGHTLRRFRRSDDSIARQALHSGHCKVAEEDGDPGTPGEMIWSKKRGQSAGFRYCWKKMKAAAQDRAGWSRDGQTSPVGGGYVQLIVAIWMYHDTTAVHLAVGHSPTVWNLLPDDLRDQGCTESTFKQSLKTYLFAQH